MDRIRRALLALAMLGLSPMAFAQNATPLISGVIEYYALTDASRRGPQHRFTWTEVNVNLNQSFRGRVTYWSFPTSGTLDDSWLEAETGGAVVRFGRQRSNFGHNDWSETMYRGFIDLPMLRVSRLVGDISLLRFDSGAWITTNIGTVQAQVGAIDRSLKKYQWWPDEVDHLVARLQTNFGPWVVGTSALTKFRGDGPDDRVFDVDLRYTHDRFELRAETALGDGEGNTARGYYVDGFYRLPGRTMTQLLARTDFLRDVSGEEHRANYLGVRQPIGDVFNVYLIYGWGNGTASTRPRSGWKAQLLTTLHF